MIVYVETNFVLELTFLREEHESCEQILRLAEQRRLGLVLPAYCIGEPYEALVRRDKRRQDVHQRLTSELRELSRSADHAEAARELGGLTGLLIASGEHERQSLNAVLQRLIQTATLIPIDADVLAGALRAQADLGLSPQDSVVYASVRSRVLSTEGSQCFVNKNTKDFLIPQIEEEFEHRGCRLIGSFHNALDFIDSVITRA